MRKCAPIFMSILLLPVILFGCQRDLLRPETKSKIIPFNPIRMVSASTVPVYNQNTKELPSFFVQHELKGNQVFVECIVTGVSFRSSDQSNQRIGKMLVWIDGKKHSEVASAAFIIKGLSPGSHKIKLEVVKLNNEPYGLSKEFFVNLPRE